MITAELLMMIGGVGAFVLTVFWVRTRDLREKYGLLWLGVATILLAIGLLPEQFKALALVLHLSYPAFMLLVALALIYPFAFFVTVALSRQYRRSARLVQEVALLEARVRDLERRLPDPAAQS